MINKSAHNRFQNIYSQVSIKVAINISTGTNLRYLADQDIKLGLHATCVYIQIKS